MAFTAEEEKCPCQRERLLLGEGFSPVSSISLKIAFNARQVGKPMRGNDGLALILTPEPPGNILPK